MSETMDEALELLSRYGPEYGGGLANHAPMVADALIALGREESVLQWLAAYSRNLDVRPGIRKRISNSDWRAALGEFNRYGDWVVFFQEQLKDTSWKELLALWVENLAPGLAAAAAHGLLRTAHIARRLEEKETEPRLKELTEGLAYWASRYQTLPVSASVPASKGQPHQVISLVPMLDASKRAGGFITDRLEKLNDFQPFAPAIHLIDDSGDIRTTLSNLTQLFVHIYLMNPRRSLIAFVHAVTGPSSLRMLLPYLSPDAQREALRYAWQLAAAIYSTNAEASYSNETEFPMTQQDDVIDRALNSGDEHAIKFTEACLREYAINPKPVYLVAARHASAQLRR